MGSKEREIAELQSSIEQSRITRAATLSFPEKFRMGADLYDEGMRWMIQIIKAENPEFDALQVDAEVERRKQIKRRIDEAGIFQPCGEARLND